MFKDWNFWFSLIAATVAVIAIIQTNQQIKISNKQHLFDKRVENYLIAIGLIQLWKNNLSHFEKHEKDKPLLAIDFEFELMTNNTYLAEITSAINNPLDNPNHIQFLIKLENLKDVATKIKFLFIGKSSVILGDFVLCYQELLFAMYQYQIMINNMQKVSQEFHLTLEQSQEKVGEKQQRTELQQALEKLRQIDIRLTAEKVEEQIKKQIKL